MFKMCLTCSCSSVILLTGNKLCNLFLKQIKIGGIF